MRRKRYINVVGSLQAHAAVGGGISPCIGTTDFGLPKVLFAEKKRLKDERDSKPREVH